MLIRDKGQLMATKHVALLNWLKTATDADVSQTGTTRNYLRLIGYGVKLASPSMAVGIESVTRRKVTRRQLRPLDWSKLWPELASSADLEPILPSDSHIRQCADTAVQASSAEVAP